MVLLEALRSAFAIAWGHDRRKRSFGDGPFLDGNSGTRGRGIQSLAFQIGTFPSSAWERDHEKRSFGHGGVSGWEFGDEELFKIPAEGHMSLRFLLKRSHLLPR